MKPLDDDEDETTDLCEGQGPAWLVGERKRRGAPEVELLELIQSLEQHPDYVDEFSDSDDPCLKPVTDMPSIVAHELWQSRIHVAMGGNPRPRFRVDTPEGEYVLFMPCADEADEADKSTSACLALIREFMLWKLAIRFVASFVWPIPNTRKNCGGLLRAFLMGSTGGQLICQAYSQNPYFIGPPFEWADPKQLLDIVESFRGYLPSKSGRAELKLTVAQLDNYFGKGGLLEAHSITSEAPGMSYGHA